MSNLTEIPRKKGKIRKEKKNASCSSTELDNSRYVNEILIFHLNFS